MRRHASSRAQALRGFVQASVLVTAALATAILLTAFASKARAAPACGDGLMSPGEAGTGALLLKTATPGRYAPTPAVATDITVDIAGAIARTRVTQRFDNPADGWVEGVYVFPLPESAAVDTLKMQIGDRFIEGQIKERQEARAVYEAAKAKGQKASLLEQERPNLFTNSVANIGPYDTVVVQIEYQETLRLDDGAFRVRVPLVVAPRYSSSPTASLVSCTGGGLGVALRDPVPDRDRIEAPVLRPEHGKVNPVTLTVALDAGFPLGVVASDNHPIAVVRNGAAKASITLDEGEVPADRDFVLNFAPKPGEKPYAALLKEHVGGADYVLALIVPPEGATRDAPAPRETIFVLDNSGSMGGESIRQAKASLLLALERLRPTDRFNVVRFDDTMEMLFSDAVEATGEHIAHAKRFVARIEANGGTEMLPALKAALMDAHPEDRTRLRQVIFLTDGAVGNEAALFAAIGQDLGRTRLFTVGIGSAPNSYFMAGAARAGRGTYTYIGRTDEVEPRMAALFEKLERPVMTDLAAHWPDDATAEAWPNPLPDLYAGEPVLITAKAAAAKGALTLTGTQGGAPWSTTLRLARADEAKGIAKLWARNKIASLEEGRIHGADPARIDAEVLSVALAHHLVSRLTSLVAVDVTPSRPQEAPLASGKVPLNLPAGWDFDKVFGETRVPLERRADAPHLQLAVAPAPSAAIAPSDAGLLLPQGATDARRLLFIGCLLLGAAAALFGWLSRNRAGSR